MGSTVTTENREEKTWEAEMSNGKDMVKINDVVLSYLMP
jgi:predicted NAD/FAD-dependent oxidoreductase